MPRRPARPVSWVYSPGVTSAWLSPFHFTSRSRTTDRAGMLMPSASVSVAKTAFTSPRTNSSSTTSLNVGSMPAWWAAMPRSRPVQPVGVAEDGQVLRRDVGAPRARRPRAPRRAPPAPSSRSPERRHCGTAASQPARLKMKVIAGSSPSASRRSMTSTRLGVHTGSRAPPAALRGAGHRPGRTAAAPGRCRTSSGLTRAFVLPSSLRRRGRRAGCRPCTCCHSGTGRCSSTMTVGVAADGDQPVAELLGVADRGRQRDQADRLGEVDDHLLPDRAAEPVGQVVHLVHHHVAEPAQGRRPGVEHVAQHLGRHHDDRGLAVDAVVAGEQPHVGRRRSGGPGRRTSGWTAP